MSVVIGQVMISRHSNDIFSNGKSDELKFSINFVYDNAVNINTLPNLYHSQSWLDKTLHIFSDLKKSNRYAGNYYKFLKS